MSCKRITKNASKICTADFDKKIKIQTTSIEGTNAPDIESAVSFSDIAVAYAMMKTKPNIRYINGVNVESGITTEIYIRYDSSIDYSLELFIEWSNDKFKVINVENINNENKTIKFNCVRHGDKSINANLR